MQRDYIIQSLCRSDQYYFTILQYYTQYYNIVSVRSILLYNITLQYYFAIAKENHSD